MKIKQLRSKGPYISAVFAAAVVLSSSSVFAQVKIGTNPTTIEPNANLEVEASTAGRKMKVDKTTGQVSIADGTQGAGKVLTSDAAGGASWQKPPSGTIVLGTLATSHITLSQNPNTFIYTGASIALSPGKWMLFVSGFMQNAGPGLANVVWYVSTSSSNLENTGITSISNPTYPTFIKGQGLLPNQTDFNFATPQVIELTATTTLYILASDGVATNSSQVYTGINRVGTAVSGTACFYAQSVQ